MELSYIATIARTDIIVLVPFLDLPAEILGLLFLILEH